MAINMRTGAALSLLLVIGTCASARYLGKRLGPLSELHHGVRGTVYAVDARTLYIDGFHYDGIGPAAYFYVGTSKTPMAAGATRLRDERGGTGPLRRYRGEGVTISLPDGHTLKDVRWFSVWCDDYSVNFGDVTIPRDGEFPKPAKVGALRGVHGVSSDPVVVVDAQTLLVPNFSYDGEAPDAKFWVGRGETPSPQGIRIPDENGKEAPLRKYDKKTIVLTLPGDLTVFDIGHFAVWCEAFTVNFGHVTLPHSALANVPPSLKMLGVSPQSRNAALTGASGPTVPALAPTPSRPAAPRRQLARLDATTYRPKLALAAGPRAASDHPVTHEHLHRRAYDQSPAQDQVLNHPQNVDIQPSQEIHYQNEQTQYYQPEQHLRYQIDQLNQQLQLQKQYQHEQSQRDQYLREQYQQSQQQHYQNQQLREQQNQQLREQQNQQLRAQQNQQQQYQDQYVQQGQQSQFSPDRALYERQLYERQIYEQQRLAYERELAQRRRAENDEPFRYRLVPYLSEGVRENRA